MIAIHLPLTICSREESRVAEAPTFLVDGPASAGLTVALAHGAGAGMDTPFMSYFAGELAGRGLRVVRFEFPYMAGYRKTGARKPPDREPVLRDTWLEVVRTLGAQKLIIGGKSMGGRIASLVADDAGVAGLVCLGYPFHPVGKPDRLRVAHLATLHTPTLILQGKRDPFGQQGEVQGYTLSPSIQIRWLTDGDHSFKPRKASGCTQQQNWQSALDEMVRFAGSLSGTEPGKAK
jgi:predicted alpha/beta-hydrolase family hydrolase